MKAAPMTQKPSFPLMKQGDVQNIYHLQMPRWLFTDPKYMELALETKVAYTFLLNRFQLSRLNGWVNEDGAVFIIYTRRPCPPCGCWPGSCAYASSALPPRSGRWPPAGLSGRSAAAAGTPIRSILR